MDTTYFLLLNSRKKRQFDHRAMARPSYALLHDYLTTTDPQTIVNILIEKAADKAILPSLWNIFCEEIKIKQEPPPPLKSLSEIYCEPILSTSFQNFLKASLCYECWEFWNAVTKYNKEWESYTESKRYSYLICNTLLHFILKS